MEKSLGGRAFSEDFCAFKEGTKSKRKKPIHIEADQIISVSSIMTPVKNQVSSALAPLTPAATERPPEQKRRNRGPSHRKDRVFSVTIVTIKNYYILCGFQKVTFRSAAAALAPYLNPKSLETLGRGKPTSCILYIGAGLQSCFPLPTSPLHSPTP